MSSRQILLLLLVAVTFILKVVNAMSVDIPAHQDECFFEELETGDKIVVSFQVGEGGNLDVDFWIQDPQNTLLTSGNRQTKGTYAATANTPGRYTYCFSNKMSTVVAKSVNFNVHVNEKNEVDENNQEDPLKVEIEELTESILAVKAEQEYIVAREIRHRNTAESTNTRVKWWSVAQLVLLVVVCLWQVRYIKHFFEVKRAV